MRKQLLALAGIVCLLLLFEYQITLPQTPEDIKKDLEAVSSRFPQILQSWQVSVPSQPPSTYQQTNTLVKNIFQSMTSKFRLLSSTESSPKLDLKSVLNNKYGNHRQMAILLAGFLEYCKIPTAIAHDNQTSLLLFPVEEDVRDTITWAERKWGVIAIKDKWFTFAQSRKNGIEFYRTLQQENRLHLTDIHALWNPPGEPSIIGLITRGKEKGQQGYLDEARGSFEEVLNLDKTNPAAYNNLGNLDVFEKKLASAMLNYLKASRYDDKDAKIYLNLGITYYLQAQETKSEKTKEDWMKHSEQAFDTAYRKIGNYEDLCHFLGFQPEGNDQYDLYRQLLLDAEERVTRKKRIALGSPGAATDEIPVYWKD